MALTEEQVRRIGVELAPLSPQLAATAPPERTRHIREALERAGVQPTWEEWDDCATALFGEDAALVQSGVLRK
ncbi:MAG: hypothetical protein U0232_14120 [Thermomicrobiales bacterium]